MTDVKRRQGHHKTRRKGKQHRGGSNKNPTAAQVPLNGMTIVQQQSIYKDIKTMNTEQDCSPSCNNMYMQPLPKRRRQQGVQL